MKYGEAWILFPVSFGMLFSKRSEKLGQNLRSYDRTVLCQHHKKNVKTVGTCNKTAKLYLAILTPNTHLGLQGSILKRKILKNLNGLPNRHI